MGIACINDKHSYEFCLGEHFKMFILASALNIIFPFSALKKKKLFCIEIGLDR